MFKTLAVVTALTATSPARALGPSTPDVPRGHVSATVGAMYDSNILIATDTVFDQGTPSRLADYRAVTAGDVRYALYRSGRHQIGPHAGASLLNSARAERAAGDPFLFSIGLPYIFDFASVPSHRLTVRPSYQRVMMDPTLTSRKLTILDSRLLTVEHTWRASAYFDTGLGVEYRRDDALLRTNVGPADADANKFTVRALETYRPRASLTQYLRADLRFVTNRARGVNARYDRYDANLIYGRLLAGRATAEFELGAYQLEFGRALPRRRDVNVSAAARARIPIGDLFGFELEARYARNAGRTRLFTYDRFALQAAFTMATGF